MTNELDRLLTITDLSEMFGVPVDTLYGWRHRGEGPAGYRGSDPVTNRSSRSIPQSRRRGLARHPSRPAPEVTWRTSSGVAFATATPPGESGPLCTTKCVTATPRGSITARQRPDWLTLSAGRLRSKSRSRPQRGEILGVVS
jgi:hypothetical protein